MSGSIEVNGELYLELEQVAEVFHVETVILHEAYAYGLLGTGLERAHRILIATPMLDRVATVVRLRVVLGLDLESVERILDASGP